MSRSRPLAPTDQKGFLCLDEVMLTETLLTQLCEVIYGENNDLKRDSAATPKALASLVLQLQFVMDELLGEKTPMEDRFSVKIPSLFFRDFAHPQGVLKHLLVWALRFRQQYQQPESSYFSRRFELNSGKNKQFSIDLIKYLWNMLKKENMWVQPRIFFMGNFTEEEIKSNHTTVTKLSGIVVENALEATHIVVPNRVIDPNDTEYYYRILERRGYRIFIHWWYFPDSYDTWIVSNTSGNQPSGFADVVAKEERLLIAPENGVWTLSIEWLEQSHRYNEWLNEADFELTNLDSSSGSESNTAVNSETPLQVKKSRYIPSGLSGRWKKQSKRQCTVQSGKDVTTDDDALDVVSEREKVVEKLPCGEQDKLPGSAQKLLRRPKRDRRSTSVGSTSVGRRKLKKAKFYRSSYNEVAFSPPYTVTLTCSESTNSELYKIHYKSFRECFLRDADFNVIHPESPNENIWHELTNLDDVDDEDQQLAKEVLRQLSQDEYHRKNPASPTVKVKDQEILVTDYRHASQTGVKASSGKDTMACIIKDHGSVNPSSSGSNSQMVSVAPGVARYPRRSLSHSVSTTHPRPMFERLRSLNPLVHDCNTNLLADRSTTEGSGGSKSKHYVETALKTMVALWASSCETPYVFGEDGASHYESPDIPPATLKEQKTFHQEVGATPHHLSSSEREVLETTYKKKLSEQLDMFEETGVTPDDASRLPIVLPETTRRWFSMDTVHGLERTLFSTLFRDEPNLPFDFHEKVETSRDAGVTALEKEESHLDLYKTVRNSMINRYRVNPLRYLTVSHCRQFINLDVGLLLKLHAFLDFWGLINFQALPHTCPSPIFHPSKHPSEVEDFSAQKMLSEKSQSRSSAFHQIPSVYCVVCKRLCSHSYYILKPSLAFGVSPALCLRVGWCQQCFAQGNFPEALTQRQFVKVSSSSLDGDAIADKKIEWTDEELEKLIEGIELYAEDWDAVARHVGSRTAADCLCHFLRLPLDEPVLHLNSNENKHYNIFQDASNPLMTQLKFLTSVLGCQVGKKSAKSSYDVLLAELRKETDSNGAKPKPLHSEEGENVQEAEQFMKNDQETKPLHSEEGENVQEAEHFMKNDHEAKPLHSEEGEIVQEAEQFMKNDQETKPLHSEEGENVQEAEHFMKNDQETKLLHSEEGENVQDTERLMKNDQETKPLHSEEGENAQDTERLMKRLQEPISESVEREATQSLLRTAASIALDCVEQEDCKIRRLLVYYNNLKEIQIKRKAIAFFLQKNTAMQNGEEFDKRVNECVKLRNELKTTLTKAYEEHEKLFNSVYGCDKKPTPFVHKRQDSTQC